ARANAIADLRRIGAREVVHPVHLPGLAVERERLFPVRAIGAVLDPQEADLDGPPAVLVLAEELAAIALEAADHRREHLAGLAVDPVDRPLALLDIERAKRDPAPALGREVELVDIDHTAEVDRAAIDRRKLLPVVAADPAGLEAAVVQGPGARDEVEVMQAAGPRGGVDVLAGGVVFGRRGLGRCGRGGRRRRTGGSGCAGGGAACGEREQEQGSKVHAASLRRHSCQLVSCMMAERRFMRASRLVSILMLLQTRGRVTARALAEHLEVSTRTVYRDIDEMSAAGVPVVVERGATGGFELLEGWRTTLTGLTPHESQTLFLSGLPGPAAEHGLGDTMASAHLKLLAALPHAWQVEAQRVSSRFHVDLAGWYRRIKPVQHLRALADAVWAARWIAVRYESWEGLVERELEPLGLVIKAGEWYLAALPRAGRPGRSGRKAPTPRTYRVSNLRELAVRDAFVRPAGFDLSAYWNESTRRFERDIYRGTAEIRLAPRGRKVLRAENAAVEEAIDQAIDQGLGADDWL